MLGFTRQEQAIVLFLIFSLLTGSVVTLYQRFWSNESAPAVHAEVIEEFTKRAEEINGDSVEQILALEQQDSTASNHEYTQFHTGLAAPASGSEDHASGNYFVVNINTAGLEELQTIPRVGPVLAQKIIDYRTQNGGFKSIDELTQVKGIGKATFNKIKPYVSIR